jgi:hypothetical protein
VVGDEPESDIWGSIAAFLVASVDILVHELPSSLKVCPDDTLSQTFLDFSLHSPNYLITSG